MTLENRGKIGEIFDAVAGLVKNEEALTLLPKLRTHLNGGERKTVDSFRCEDLFMRGDLLELLEDVHLAFAPVARGLIRRRIGSFYGLTGEDQEDIYSEQGKRLWENIILRFRWEDYSGDAGAAKGAFWAYLEKSAGGAFFAKNAIKGQKILKMPVVNGSWGNNPERVLIRTERREVLGKVLETWAENSSPLSVRIIVSRFMDGFSIEETSEREGVTSSAIKHRTAKAKTEILKILKETNKEYGWIGLSDLIIKSSTRVTETREELLKLRRQMLLARYSEWKDLMPPKTRDVLVFFYGLDGQGPSYSYEETAEAFGLGLGGVGVYISQGLRIIMGKEQPSQRLVERKRNKGLYFNWRGQSEDSAQLTKKQKKVMFMYFELGLSLGEIGKRLSTSTTTIRREKERALNAIEMAARRDDFKAVVIS